MFIPIKSTFKKIAPESKLNYLFCYEPDPLTSLVVSQLQEYIAKQSPHWAHNFGIENQKETMPIGKMFGVLVVKNQEGELGYLAAFSGTLIDNYHPPIFVPQINNSEAYELEYEESKTEVTRINLKIEENEKSSQFQLMKKNQRELSEGFSKKLEEQKIINSRNKEKRKKLRLMIEKSYDDSLSKALDQESLEDKYKTNKIKREYGKAYTKLHKELSPFTKKVEALKKVRLSLLRNLQQKQYTQYRFSNALGEFKTLLEVYKHPFFKKPPAGTGDCAAPKLLQYAFLNSLEPISLAEFWWGTPHKLQIRKHKNFYPACTSRCKPILEHMLSKTEVQESPLLKTEDYNKKIEILFEDEYLIIVSKPANILSAPGRIIKQNILTLLSNNNDIRDELHTIHRLDQETSGILMIAKDKETQKKMQKLFIEKKIDKTYLAVLDGHLSKESGTIDLPLTPDPHNIPYQKVCYTSGKQSLTKYKVIKHEKNKTYLYLFPKTGRTHQLRVHCAHHHGLNLSIIGDSLYGQRKERLMLHAQKISFSHPYKSVIIDINCEIDMER